MSNREISPNSAKANPTPKAANGRSPITAAALPLRELRDGLESIITLALEADDDNWRDSMHRIAQDVRACQSEVKALDGLVGDESGPRAAEPPAASVPSTPDPDPHDLDGLSYFFGGNHTGQPWQALALNIIDDARRILLVCSDALSGDEDMANVRQALDNLYIRTGAGLEALVEARHK